MALTKAVLLKLYRSPGAEQVFLRFRDSDHRSISSIRIFIILVEVLYRLGLTHSIHLIICELECPADGKILLENIAFDKVMG